MSFFRSPFISTGNSHLPPNFITSRDRRIARTLFGGRRISFAIWIAVTIMVMLQIANISTVASSTDPRQLVHARTSSSQTAARVSHASQQAHRRRTHYAHGQSARARLTSSVRIMRSHITLTHVRQPSVALFTCRFKALNEQMNKWTNTPCHTRVARAHYARDRLARTSRSHIARSCVARSRIARSHRVALTRTRMRADCARRARLVPFRPTPTSVTCSRAALKIPCRFENS